MPDDQPDGGREQLRERVADLEQLVESQRERLNEQQQTISRMLPGRRGVLAGAGLLGAGGVVGRLSSGTARAEAAGQQGTEDDPNDIQAWDINVQNRINGGGVLSEGDEIERQVWIIPNGADDPGGADPEDIIFEEES